MRRSKVMLVVLLSLLLSSGPAFSEIPSEMIPNWTAPPLWSPPEKAAKEAEAPDAGGGPLSVAGAVPTSPLPFVGIAPCRIADTRSGSGFAGQYGPPQITPSGRTVTIVGQCGIPADAEAVSFNFHAVNVTAAGFLVAYPAGGSFPPVAIMAYNQNTPNISNSAVVPLGTGGAIEVVAGVTNIDLIIDTNGYYGPNLDTLYVNEGQGSSVTSAMITDGAIVDADINASAAITDTKLATISTAGKVADSALSANVTKLGPTIEASEITNITRSISIPLLAFMDCDTGAAAFLDFASGAADRKADFTGIGSGAEGFALHFDNDPGQEDQNTEICSQLVLPPDYVSGGQFRVLMQKGAHAGATETLNCAVGGNTSGIGGQGAVITTTNVSTIYTCAPPLPSLQAGDTLRISLKMTSDIVMDDLVLLYSVAFEYTASQ